MTTDVTIHQCDSGDNVTWCSQVAEKGWIHPAEQKQFWCLEAQACFPVGLQHAGSSFSSWHKTTLSAAVPHTIIGHSPKRLVTVYCGKVNGPAMRIAVHYPHCARWDMKSRQEALRSQFYQTVTRSDYIPMCPQYPAVVWIFCNRVHWAHSVGERTHCKLKQQNDRVSDWWLTHRQIAAELTDASVWHPNLYSWVLAANLVSGTEEGGLMRVLIHFWPELWLN